MRLLFQNSRGEERVIAEPQNREEVIDKTNNNNNSLKFPLFKNRIELVSGW